MNQVSITVRADWDEEARVWVASSDDIAGLAIEAENLEALEKKLQGALRDLVEVNGLKGLDNTERNIPLRIVTSHETSLPNPCFA